MSLPSRAPDSVRPGAPPPHRRWGRFLAHAAGAAAALGLALATGAAATAATAATHAGAPATPLHTYYVAPSGTDTTGSCTANTAKNAFPAIAAALACAVNGDAISLAPTGSTPYQGFGTVSQNITISAKSGANARTVTVDATASANLTVAAGATVTVTGVTIDGSDAGAADVTNNGTLALTRDAITNNDGNGGIDNFGSLTLNASTVSGNTALRGGGIDSGGGTSVVVNNSTIADNTATITAGGVDLTGGTATFVNSTIAGNDSPGAGGLEVSATATASLSNTLIAGNTGLASAPDCEGALTDGPGGHNLIGNPGTACTGLANGADGDQVSAAAGLMPLANNGGPTDTAALMASSPAVGGGNPATCAQAPISGKDQRGDSRKVTTRGCDIGAYDTAGKIVSLHTYYVAPNGTDSTGSCTANTASNAFPAIAAALACAVSGDAISLAPTGAAPYQGFGTVSQDITISAASGANARTVTVDATNSANLTVTPGSDVLLTGVTINGSNDAATPDVTNNGGLTLTRDAITSNPASGGIVSSTTGSTNAELTLNSSTVSGNGGGNGAGIDVGPGTALTANNSTIADNIGGTTADGVDVSVESYGTFVNSTISGNQGSSAVGGLYTGAAAGAVVLSNTIIAGNTGGSAFPDCRGALADGPGGHNLIGNATSCAGLTNGVNGDQVNVAAPGLGSLANNGGPTNTAALATGSPAIGTGAAATCEQGPIGDKDQRGDSRNATSRGACDIGAYDTGGAS